MSTFDDFVAKWNGKPCEVEDASNPDQCMDLAFAWCDAINVDRATIRRLYAYQVWSQPNDLEIKVFDYIPNTPNGVPPQGALVVFNQSVGAAGHISIASGEGDEKSFQSFDQNWSGVQYCKMVTHVYTSVSGWLVPRKPVSTDPIIIAQSDAFIAVATSLNTAANKDIVLAEIEKLKTIEDQAPAKDRQLSDALSQITFLEDRTKTLQEDHDTVAKENATLTQTIQDQDGQIKVLSESISDLKTELQQASKYPTMSSWDLIVEAFARLYRRK